MADLVVTRGDVPYTELPRRMSTLDARLLVREAGLESLADSFEPRAGVTRVIWASEPSDAEVRRLQNVFNSHDE